MSEIDGVYWVWLRELIRFWRFKSRILTSIIQPLLFLIVLGGGFSFVSLGSVNYQSFLFPGIIAMSLLFSSISSGISVIWDREFGFLKEILVAPVSRLSIFFGKALGGASTAIIQGLIILALSFILSIVITPSSFLISLAVMLIFSLGMVSVGLIIASFLESFESFGVIMNLLIFPIFLLSGALFPLNEAPEWLKAISMFNPMTYATDALRGAIIGTSTLPLMYDFIVISVFSVVMIIIGGISFNRQK